jgi:thioredoxin reductase (NADPH)
MKGKGKQMKYDLIVIGAGPAGISASLYAVSRGLHVMELEKEKVGGIIGKVSTVTHYSAILPGETGETFAKRLEEQALAAGVTLRYENVVGVELSGDVKQVTTGRQTYEADAVILANGSTPNKLGIPGEAELTGRGFGMNAAQDGGRYRGKDIYVVGGADGAIKEAVYLAQFAKKLTVIHFERQLGAIAEFTRKLSALPNAEVRLGKRLTAVFGTDHVEKLELTDEATGKKEWISDDGCGIFVYAGTSPNTRLCRELELAGGYIPVNEKMETAIRGVYAAGDIRVKQVRQAATAVADGAIAGINAAAFCKARRTD